MTAVRLAAVALVALLAGAGAAAAASLGVAPKRLTTFTSTDQLPISRCTAGTTADAYVDELSGLLGSNFGSATELRVQSLALGDRRTFARFDLAACGIPSTATILSARMRLTLTQAPSSGRTYPVHRVTAGWTEGGLTWSNQPAVAGSSTASASTGTTTGATVEWDVTADVSAFVGGTATNHGWRVRDASEDALLAAESRFAARESSAEAARPVLVVRYRR